MITGGSVRKVTGKKLRGFLDAVLSGSYQPVRRERLYPGSVISFTDEDFLLKPIEPHEGALVITAQVGSMDMKRMMIDNGSSIDIL